jgi:hypothetical protein
VLGSIPSIESREREGGERERGKRERREEVGRKGRKGRKGREEGRKGEREGKKFNLLIILEAKSRTGWPPSIQPLVRAHLATSYHDRKHHGPSTTQRDRKPGSQEGPVLAFYNSLSWNLRTANSLIPSKGNTPNNLITLP